MAAFFLTGFGLCCISASASVNTVQAGSMDISFELSRDGKWCNAEGVTMAFCDASGSESDTLVWEPGCTYDLPMLRICNNSELDVKYTVAISGINGDDKLNEVIDWYYVTDDGAVELTEISGTLPAGAVTETFTIRGHMHESASNAYQGLTIDSIALTVAATQASNPSEPGAGETGVPYYAINTDTDLVIDERNSYIILDDEVQNILASVGLSLLLYPSFANWWNSFHQSRAIASYSEVVANMDDDQYDEIWNAAWAYNRSLAERTNSYLLSEEQQQTYNELLNVGGNGVMGYIEIPAIDVTLITCTYGGQTRIVVYCDAAALGS